MDDFGGKIVYKSSDDSRTNLEGGKILIVSERCI